MFRLHKDRLKIDKKLGKGAYGSVYPYQKNENDFKWVVKVITGADADTLLTSLPEIVFGFACDHPFIVPIKGYRMEKDLAHQGCYNIYIKLPRMKMSLLDDFKNRKRNNDPYTEKEITRYFYSLICGLEYLHSKKIYHGDIKPDNLLIDEDGKLKIADVGIAKHVDEEDSYQTLTGQLGTYQYSAPEIIRANRIADKKRILPKGDVWSLGVVMLELCAFHENKLLNSLTPQEELMNQVHGLLDNLEERYTSPLLALIKKMLSFDSKQRPSVEEVKSELETNFSRNLVNLHLNH